MGALPPTAGPASGTTHLATASTSSPGVSPSPTSTAQLALLVLPSTMGLARDLQPVFLPSRATEMAKVRRRQGYSASAVKVLLKVGACWRCSGPGDLGSASLRCPRPLVSSAGQLRPRWPSSCVI
ncbi:hypothetical protein VPH35_010429 [Triticum aestivum]